MLEILSHQYLKKFVRSQSIDWGHIFSFGRIISKCLRDNDSYLINSEIFSTKDWLPAILIPLFLNEENSTFVLSNEVINFIKSNHIEHLKYLGFKYILENDQIIFQNHHVKLISLKNLLNDPNSSSLKNHRIVLSGVENIKQDLKEHFRISLIKKDWFKDDKHLESVNQEIINTYNIYKKKFFLNRVLGNTYLILDKNEEIFFYKFFCENSLFSDQFLRVSNALSQGWACWVELDNLNFEWNLCLQPINELFLVRELIHNNKFVYLSSLRRDIFFQQYLKKQSLKIDLVINFKSNFCEKNISLYVPSKQMLPNNPLFTGVILDKCKKLIIFSKGLTVILADDNLLKNTIATDLASHYGKRVLLDSLPFLNNQVLCTSYDWWIKNSHLIQIPQQIIIPSLPIPNLSDPFNLLTFSQNKNLSKDWFRDFLFPEAVVKLERAIAPLRRNSGKVIVLDGRATKRKWGRLLLQNIQPSKQINYLLPFD